MKGQKLVSYVHALTFLFIPQNWRKCVNVRYLLESFFCRKSARRNDEENVENGWSDDGADAHIALADEQAWSLTTLWSFIEETANIKEIWPEFFKHHKSMISQQILMKVRVICPMVLTDPLSRISVVLSNNWLSLGPFKFAVSTIKACLLLSTANIA